jgi:hypothetical protein
MTAGDWGGLAAILAVWVLLFLCGTKAPRR